VDVAMVSWPRLAPRHLKQRDGGQRNRVTLRAEATMASWPQGDAVAELGELSDGAELAEFQPQELVRVMLDPAGHPLCLYVEAGG
jgi:hypothetical protein